MGRYYINASGEAADIAAVAEDHYAPLGPSDDVPRAPLSATVALADKLDMLTGFWAIGEKPTGSKDPFALRRAALGVIRLIVENDLRLDLYEALARAMFPHALRRDMNGGETSAEKRHEYALITGLEPDDFDTSPVKALVSMLAKRGLFGTLWDTLNDRNSNFREDASKIKDLLGFIHDRLKVLLRDRGIRHDIIDACLAQAGSDDLTRLVRRAEALNTVLGTEDGQNLLQGFRRANNILTQAETRDDTTYTGRADPTLAAEPAEASLFAALDAAEAVIEPALDAEDYAAAMAAMAGLRSPVDGFFEAVQVNSDDADLRRNRLILLGRSREVCSSVADLSRVEG